MIDGQIFFDQPTKNDQITYDNFWKIATGHGDYYRTDGLVDSLYFKEHYKVIAMDLSKQEKLDTDLKAIQQINFTGHVDGDGNTQMFFIIEEVK